MIDNLLGGGDDDEGSDESDGDDMGGGLFDADEGGDDLMDGSGDDLMGDDDLMGGDDMEFDEMDDGGSSSAEMDNRLDELENEVASLSSTVNTVKSENEQISESVGEVEENIRKLLEVYEMVTRGVNPFVDESEMGDAFGGGGGGSPSGGSMGLFDDGGDDTDADVDESVADADADEFFDDDLDDGFDDSGFEEDGFGDSPEDDTGSGGFDDGEFEDDFGDELEDDGLGDGFGGDDFEDDQSGDGDDSGGKSFEELKAEYDSGDANWDEDESGGGSAPEDVPTDDTASIDDGLADDEGSVSGSETGANVVDDTGATTDDRGTASGSEDAPTAETSERSGDTPVDGGKPYLETLPAGYVADIVVMDWLEFLVEEAGVDGAARTIAYYEAIEWVDDEAAETLQTFLNGFGEGVESDPDPQSSLTVAHHNRSLKYISRIANPDMEMVAFEDWGGERSSGPPGIDGVRARAANRSDRERSSQGIESDGGLDIGGNHSGEGRGRPSGPGGDDVGFNWGGDRTE